jgi:hypothetical protein
MRTRDFFAAATMVLLAVPALAQTPGKDVTGPWTINSDLVTCTDLPILTKPIPRLTVRGRQDTDDRFAMATGDTVVIARTPDDGLAVGQRYVASRLNNPEKYFPRPGEGYGGLRVTGFITVTAINQWNALANVDYACDMVQPGDYLEPFVEGTLPTAAAPMLYPDFTERAVVLFGADNRTLFGHGDVLSIDRGTAQGVTVGARYAVYRDKYRGDGTPLVHLGEVVVLTTSETTSKVMVTSASGGIQSGDTVVPRRLKEPAQ